MTEKKIDIHNETERLFSEIDRVISDPEERKELKEGFTLLQQKFLFRWEGARDLDMEERVTNIVMNKLEEIHEKDNDQLCNNVAEIVVAQNRKMMTALDIQTESIKGIHDNVKEIKETITDMKTDVSVIKKRLDIDEQMIAGFEKRLEQKRGRIETLENEVKVLRPEAVEAYIKEIQEFRPIVTKLIRTQAWWNIALRILIAVAISAIIALIIHYNVPQKYELLPNQEVEIITK